MDLLQQITFNLPDKDHDFNDKFFEVLSLFGERESDRVDLEKSNPDFLPNISFATGDVIKPTVVFDVTNHQIEIVIENKTGQEKKSPETYTHISIEDFVKRVSQLEPVHLDHVGFNLPWFDGVHPDVLMLRKELAGRSAYHRFPTGEDWDFILPALKDEMQGEEIDLEISRRPKFEIVSFEKASEPLIQIDFSVRENFNDLASLFPEGILDKNLKNIWVYVTNPYGLDLCFVVGEYKDGDWSKFFSGNRLTD
jgi:hypothetical protein